MKRVIGALSVLLLLGVVISCKQPASPDSNNTASSNTEAKKLALYEDIKGLWKENNSETYYFFGEYKSEYDPYKSKIYPLRDGVPQPYSTYAGLTTYERLQEQNADDVLHGWTWNKFVQKMKDSHQEANIDTYKNCLLHAANDISFHIYIVEGDNLFQTYAGNPVKYKFTRVNTSGGGGGSSVTLSGNYEIKEANGSTFKMTGGNWTFTYNSQTKNGTYTQSGNELTVNYTQGGYNISAVFTVSKSGDIITLTGKSGNYAGIIANAFMAPGAVTSGVVKLAAK